MEMVNSVPLYLVFLDIDGVLNSWSWMRQPEYEADDVSLRGNTWDVTVKRLNKWIRTNELPPDQQTTYYIISSTKRVDTELKEFQEVLFEKGLYDAVIGTTPQISQQIYPHRTHGRGLEIQYWIERYLTDEKRENLKVLILDDDSDMGILKCALTKTSMAEGFSETHAQTPPKWVAWKDIQALEEFHAVFRDERFRAYDPGTSMGECGGKDVDTEGDPSSET